MKKTLFFAALLLPLGLAALQSCEKVDVPEPGTAAFTYTSDSKLVISTIAIENNFGAGVKIVSEDMHFRMRL